MIEQILDINEDNEDDNEDESYLLDMFAMNFGSWESKVAKYKNLIDCHVHLIYN